MNRPTLICLALSLLLSGCATSDPTPPTQLRIEPVVLVCELTPCRLPGRPALIRNEDWPAAVDEVEDALTSCATQVLDCISKQEVATHATQGQAPVSSADVSGQDSGR
ncbi:Rz1-like lysis system protein LysC [Pseudomonas maioricensis]|uniref:Rz1-like lysis system protein LysC n=1 Tax=Pseudomonas maioricensis TaxID=1766623 RepID=UPI003BF4C437